MLREKIGISLLTGLLLLLLSSCEDRGGQKISLESTIDSLNHELQAERHLNDKYQYYINKVLPKLDKSLSSEQLASVTVATPGDLDQQVAFPSAVSSPSNARVAAPAAQGKFFHVARFEYQPGSPELTEGMRKKLVSLADSLKNSEKYLIMIEGHCDKIEAGNDPRIKDGWELSAERSAAVVRFLRSRGVYPHMMIASGRSNFKPIASASSKEELAKNRRVDIYLLPSSI